LLSSSKTTKRVSRKRRPWQNRQPENNLSDKITFAAVVIHPERQVEKLAFFVLVFLLKKI
jgi:hypothetical protein